ncbi:hypothetical protein [Kitasatospora sp. NPDC001175]|uniref:hypothetical protein n=1 Tax=Kitasatospora sp. NPDC001175 TaxID=3157103 RepID=UPI003D02D33D
MRVRNKLVAAATVAVAFGGVFLSAGSASASGGGSCGGNDACLYYYQGLKGGSFGDPSVDTYQYNSNYLFDGCNNGSCGGDGKYVRNAAASVWNVNPTNTVRIYYSPDQSGPYQDIAPRAWANLNDTLRNQNASQDWHG